jgi:hypothetical protein
MFDDLTRGLAENDRRNDPQSRHARFAVSQIRTIRVATIFLLFVVCLCAFPLAAQYTPPPPPPPAEPSAPPPPPPGQRRGPAQLEQLVARIALYPDPLLAQILTATTYWNEVPEAAAWADAHSYLHGDALAQAIRADNLQWDPSVLALLPFPSVLDMMARDLSWTQELGTAVLTQRADVMDAIQRMRKKAYDYGYLRSNAYCYVTNTGGYIEIQPVNPAYIYVPFYDPVVVFGPPRPGFAISGAIRFGPSVVIGASFFPWGWAHPHFLWGGHAIIVDDTPWNRVWINRGFYVHPYAHPWVHVVGPRAEHHRFHRR